VKGMKHRGILPDFTHLRRCPVDSPWSVGKILRIERCVENSWQVPQISIVSALVDPWSLDAVMPPGKPKFSHFLVRDLSELHPNFQSKIKLCGEGTGHAPQ